MPLLSDCFVSQPDPAWDVASSGALIDGSEVHATPRHGEDMPEYLSLDR